MSHSTPAGKNGLMALRGFKSCFSSLRVPIAGIFISNFQGGHLRFLKFSDKFWTF